MSSKRIIYPWNFYRFVPWFRFWLWSLGTAHRASIGSYIVSIFVFSGKGFAKRSWQLGANWCICTGIEKTWAWSRKCGYSGVLIYKPVDYEFYCCFHFLIKQSYKIVTEWSEWEQGLRRPKNFVVPTNTPVWERSHFFFFLSIRTLYQYSLLVPA